MGEGVERTRSMASLTRSEVISLWEARFAISPAFELLPLRQAILRLERGIRGEDEGLGEGGTWAGRKRKLIAAIATRIDRLSQSLEYFVLRRVLSLRIKMGWSLRGVGSQFWR